MSSYFKEFLTFSTKVMRMWRKKKSKLLFRLKASLYCFNKIWCIKVTKHILRNYATELHSRVKVISNELFVYAYAKERLMFPHTHTHTRILKPFKFLTERFKRTSHYINITTSHVLLIGSEHNTAF